MDTVCLQTYKFYICVCMYIIFSNRKKSTLLESSYFVCILKISYLQHVLLLEQNSKHENERT